jgi:hypothetical protein
MVSGQVNDPEIRAVEAAKSASGAIRADTSQDDLRAAI